MGLSLRQAVSQHCQLNELQKRSGFNEGVLISAGLSKGLITFRQSERYVVLKANVNLRCSLSHLNLQNTLHDCTILFQNMYGRMAEESRGCYGSGSLPSEYPSVYLHTEDMHMHLHSSCDFLHNQHVPLSSAHKQTCLRQRTALSSGIKACFLSTSFSYRNTAGKKLYNTWLYLAEWILCYFKRGDIQF